MKRCDDTITVINRRIGNDGGYIYVPSVIKGVSWFRGTAASVSDKGLKVASSLAVRIPMDADFGGKSYTDPTSYAAAVNYDGLFTLALGDLIIRAVVDGSDLTPDSLKEQYYDTLTILGVTDSSHAPKEPHFRVVGG